MKVGFFCKHHVALECVKVLLPLSKPQFIVVEKTYASQDWYNEIRTLAKEINIALLEVSHIKNAVDQINAYGVDLIFSVMYTQKVPVTIIEQTEKGIINFHPSLLPKYRGPHPVNWAMIKGETQTGVTAHFMSGDIDAGSIILVKKIAIEFEDTLSVVSHKLMNLIPDMLLKTYHMVTNSNIVAIPQNDAESSYHPRRTEADDQIIWFDGVLPVYNLIRTLTAPLPGAYFFYQGQKFTVLKGSIVNDKLKSGVIGEILMVENSAIEIALGDGVMKLENILVNSKPINDLSRYFIVGGIIQEE